MNRSAWENFQGATLSLARSGALKDRLNDAYRNHLSCIDETELPKELREDFRSFSDTLTRERPLLRGEDAFAPPIRKMSNDEAEDCRDVGREDVLRAPARGRSPASPRPTATAIVPLYLARNPRAAEA